MILMLVGLWLLALALMGKGGAAFVLVGGAIAFVALVLSLLVLTLALVRRGPRRYLPFSSDRL